MLWYGEICQEHDTLRQQAYQRHTELRSKQLSRNLQTSEREVTATEQPATLVAFLVATVESEIPIYRLGEFAFIHDIWVEPEYRQVGIAKAMLMKTISSFSQRGVKQIRLDTAVANEAARRLFASCGFRFSTMEMLIELD